MSRAEEEDLLIAARDNLGLGGYQTANIDGRFYQHLDDTIATPGAVTIVDTHEVQRLAAQLFAGVSDAIERERQTPAFRLAPRDPQLAPVHLTQDIATLRRLEQGFERLVTLDVRSKPVREFAVLVSQQLDVPVVMDPRVYAEQPVTCQIANVPVRTALRMALDTFNLSCFPEASGRYVIISTGDHRYHLNGQQMVAYPVPDLVGLPGGGQDYQPLMDLIRSYAEPDSWQDVGGPGRILSGGNGRVLFVNQQLGWHSARHPQSAIASLRRAEPMCWHHPI